MVEVDGWCKMVEVNGRCEMVEVNGRCEMVEVNGWCEIVEVAMGWWPRSSSSSCLAVHSHDDGGGARVGGRNGKRAAYCTWYVVFNIDNYPRHLPSKIGKADSRKEGGGGGGGSTRRRQASLRYVYVVNSA
eukprot:3653321-Pleurochrysis_carterae.AAC.1